MNELIKKKEKFKQILNSIQKATDAVYKAEAYIRTYPEEDMIDIEITLAALSDLLINSMRRLFEISPESYSLVRDEWFWMEWTATDECFYYILGSTSVDREAFREEYKATLED